MEDRAGDAAAFYDEFDAFCDGVRRTRSDNERLAGVAALLQSLVPVLERARQGATDTAAATLAGAVPAAGVETMTVEQLRAEGLPEKWAAFGKGWITNVRWIETIYNQAHKDAPKQ